MVEVSPGGSGRPGEGHLTQIKRRAVRTNFQEEATRDLTLKEYKEYASTERVEE